HPSQVLFPAGGGSGCISIPAPLRDSLPPRQRDRGRPSGRVRVAAGRKGALFAVPRGVLRARRLPPSPLRGASPAGGGSWAGQRSGKRREVPSLAGEAGALRRAWCRGLFLAAGVELFL